MRVSEVMSSNVKIASPNQSIIEAAKMMADSDCGILPVGEHDHLVGMVTDRDIVLRALATGKGDKAQVKDVMSAAVRYCFDDDVVDDVAKNMGELQVRRLPVVNRQKRLVGMLSLGDIASTGEVQCAGDALCHISEPASKHASEPRQH